MDEKKKLSCICALGTVPPVSASETSAEGTECTDEEKPVDIGLVVLRGINNFKRMEYEKGINCNNSEWICTTV